MMSSIKMTVVKVTSQKIIILTKLGTDTINTVIPKKYQKYPSTIILQHANNLTKVNKLPYMSLLKIMPHDAHSVTIHVRIITPM